MAAAGMEGPSAVNYLRYALGVSRASAYNLLRGTSQVTEENAKALSPLLGADYVERLKMEAQRRALLEAAIILFDLGEKVLGRELKEVAKKLEKPVGAS